MPVEPSWFGCVSSPRDTYILLEACRQGILPKVTRRLTDMERIRLIQPGACFVWEEAEAGIKRWTDSFKWSPSRVSGAFLIYSELPSEGTPGSGLYKQSFSSTIRDGSKMHLIAYYDKKSLESGTLPSIQDDVRLQNVAIPAGVYPDHRATGIDQPMPKVFPTYSLPSVLQKGSDSDREDQTESRPATAHFEEQSQMDIGPSTRHNSLINSYPPQSQFQYLPGMSNPLRRASSSGYLPALNYRSSSPPGRRPSAPNLSGPQYFQPSWSHIPSSTMPMSIDQQSSGSESDRLPTLAAMVSDQTPSLPPPRSSFTLPFESAFPSRHTSAHPASLSSYSWSPQLPPLPNPEDDVAFVRRTSEHAIPPYRRASLEEEIAKLPQSRSSEDNRQLNLLKPGF